MEIKINDIIDELNTTSDKSEINNVLNKLKEVTDEDAKSFITYYLNEDQKVDPEVNYIFDNLSKERLEYLLNLRINLLTSLKMDETEKDTVLVVLVNLIHQYRSMETYKEEVKEAFVELETLKDLNEKSEISIFNPITSTVISGAVYLGTNYFNKGKLETADLIGTAVGVTAGIGSGLYLRSKNIEPSVYCGAVTSVCAVTAGYIAAKYVVVEEDTSGL